MRWRAERPGLDQDEFIDDIPFPETQNYVKRILGTAEDYRMLYGKGGGRPIPVSDLDDGPPASAAPAPAAPSKASPAAKPAAKKPATTKAPARKPPAKKKSPAKPAGASPARN